MIALMASGPGTLTDELCPQMAALPRFLEFVARENPRLVPGQLENVRHLPVQIGRAHV